MASQAAVAAIGFADGGHALPVLIAPTAAGMAEGRAVAVEADCGDSSHRGLTDSDALHWREGRESVSNEADVSRLEQKMLRVGELKTFDNVVVPGRRAPA